MLLGRAVTSVSMYVGNYVNLSARTDNSPFEINKFSSVKLELGTFEE